MNLFLIGIIIFVIVYLFLNWFARTSSKKIATNIKKFTEFSAAITSIKPEEGDLLIFPSYLYHSVSKNLSTEERIVISFNIDIEN